MYKFVFFAAALCGFVGAQHHDHKVPVTVYYESLCPDSIKFFTKQLYPSLQGSLADFVNLTLIPFGKATVEQDGGAYKFTCHHAENECRGNKLHACALKSINQGVPDQNSGFSKTAVAFINCLMDKVDRHAATVNFPAQECATINHVSDFVSIENCANHPQGSEYLANYGKLTDSFQKPLKGVPTIVFNRQYSEEDNKAAQENFVKALCRYIDHDKPAECTKSGAASLTASLAALVAGLALLKY